MDGFGGGLGDEEVGRASMTLERDLAVSRALARLRHGLGDDWQAISAAEVRRLDRLFGELYALMSRREWDSLRFSSIGLLQVYSLLALASRMARDPRSSGEVVRQVRHVLRVDEGAGVL